MTPTSPYVRKARVTARELGLSLDEVPVQPHDDDPTLLEHHPLCRVPVLLTDLGPIHDSRVVVRYLLSVGKGGWPGGWPDEVLEATADGLLDSAVIIVLEQRRPPEKIVQAVIDRQGRKITSTVSSLKVPDGAFPTVGQVALAVTLGYLDFRTPHLPWRSERRDLAAWYEEIAKRPSMEETKPPA